jgi:hypothetical protein
MAAIMDCTIRSAAELTGVTYDKALAMLGDKYVIGQGASGRDLVAALEAAGMTVLASPLTPDDAVAKSENGCKFLMVGRKNGSSHAWTITDGKANRPFLPPYRHQIYEVTR